MRRLIKTMLGQDFDLDIRGMSLIERLFRALRRSLLRKRQKVFCIGMQKTGTTSLGQALKFLGYRVNKWNAGRWSLRFENCSDWLASLARYDAVEDEPAALLWRQLEKEYPNSLFILTTRNDKAWLESAKRFYSEYAGRRKKVSIYNRQKSLAFRNFVYDGHGDPKMYPEEWLKRK